MLNPLSFLNTVVRRQAERGICDPLTASACAVSDYNMALWGQGLSLGEPERAAAMGQCIRAFPRVHREVLEELQCKMTP